MKQYITVEDLNKLTDKGKERLKEWWKPEFMEPIVRKFNMNEIPDYDLEYVFWQSADTYEGWMQTRWDDGGLDQTWKKEELKKKCLPLLSIGQMIEFLENNKHEEITISKKNGDWDYKHDHYHYWHRYGQELCDALWSACLEVLNKE